MELTILMPCLNEEKTLGRCIEKAQGFIRESGVSGEVLIADNGSTDSSVEIAKKMGARVVAVEEKGYGAALIGGLHCAQGKYVIMGDADDSYDFSSLGVYLDALRAGAELVIGNRFKGGIEKGAMPALHKYLGNPVLSWIGRVFFKVPVGDFHCGLRGYDRERLLELGLTSPGMEFASEMVVKAALAKLEIIEVPTRLYKDGRDRAPHLRTWRDGWRHLRFLLLFSPRWLFFYPGVAFLLIGVFGQAALFGGGVQLLGIRLDIHTMLYAAGAFIVGAQLVLLSIIARSVSQSLGLLPESRREKLIEKVWSVEYGVVLGLCMILVGFIATGQAVLTWEGGGYKELDPGIGMRMAIPAVSLVVVGVQLVFSSFFYGLSKVVRS